MEGSFINCNGKIYKTGKLVVSASNRSFRYGDGCFETIRITNGKIIGENYHFERLFSSLETLLFQAPVSFTADFLKKEIYQLLQKNNQLGMARVRLVIFRGDGSLYDPINHIPNYLIQSWELDAVQSEFNTTGLAVDVFPDARKPADLFSSIKSNNFLPYAMGALYAQRNHLQDVILLNAENRLADSTIANVFIVQNGTIKTPALSEGPVSGTMRRYLLKCMREENIPVQETTISVEEALEASEIFLTNAIFGIKWVQQLRKSFYGNQVSRLLHNRFIHPLFQAS